MATSSPAAVCFWQPENMSIVLISHTFDMGLVLFLGPILTWTRPYHMGVRQGARSAAPPLLSLTSRTGQTNVQLMSAAPGLDSATSHLHKCYMIYSH